MFWRLLLLGGLMVTAGTAGVVFMDSDEGSNTDAGRLVVAITDAKELRCTGSTSEWEVKADVLARDLGNDPIESADLAVAYWPTPGAPRETAAVRIVERDGFAAGVVSDASLVKFQPVLQVDLPCGSETAELIARVQVAGETLDASDEFLSAGVAMASPVIIGTVLIGLVALAYLGLHR